VNHEGHPTPPGTDAAEPSADIFVDLEGDWYHGAQLITREDLLVTFYQNLQTDASGGYFVEWHGQRCGIQVADTPFVISRVDIEVAAPDHQPAIALRFKHWDRREVLDPATLRVGSDHVLYCRVLDGRFSARFSRPAYYQLARWIEWDEDGGGFFLRLGDNRYPIAEAEAS
jgi:hypothetical protein